MFEFDLWQSELNCFGCVCVIVAPVVVECLNDEDDGVECLLLLFAELFSWLMLPVLFEALLDVSSSGLVVVVVVVGVEESACEEWVCDCVVRVVVGYDCC